MRIELKKDERLARGERLIVVDGVVWGHTVVTWHGCHGSRTAFKQKHGDMIGRTTTGGRFIEETVRSASERRSKTFINGQYRVPDDFKDTPTRVVEKIKELIEAKALIHPDRAKKASEDAEARYQRRREEAIKREENAFRSRALQACGYSAEPNDPESIDLVERVISAMRWAQSQ
jgi:hypothetical protein